MIHAHSLGRAAHYYGERTALALGAARPTFRELHDRVAGIAAALGRHGFRAGDRLAMLLPNEHDYLELVYACAWLGVIAVPVNIRLSARSDRNTSVAAGARPRTVGRSNRSPSRSDLRPRSDFGSGLHERHNRPSQRRRRDSRQHSSERRPSQLLDALSRRRRASSRRANFSHLGLSIHVRGTRFRCLPSGDPEVQPAKLLRNGTT